MLDENPLSAALRRILGIPSNSANVQALVNKSADHESDRIYDVFVSKYHASFRGNLDLKATPIGQEILALDESAELRLLLRATARMTANKLGPSNDGRMLLDLLVAKKLVSHLLRRPLPYQPEDLERIILALCDGTSMFFPYQGLMHALTKYSARNHGLPESVRNSLNELRSNLRRFRNDRTKLDVADSIDDLLGEATAPEGMTISPGEAWSDAAIADLKNMTTQQRAAWIDLLVHAHSADGTKPTKKWLATAAEKVSGVGKEDFCRTTSSWLSLIAKPRTEPLPESTNQWEPDKNQLIDEGNATLLKGLIWCGTGIDDAPLTRAIADAAIAAYRKIKNHGPRNIKIANAAVIALTAMPGTEPAAQLGRLAAQVKQPSGRKYIATALSRISDRTGQSPDELAELSIPTYGLGADGKLHRTFDNFTAELAITGSTDVITRWQRADGKSQKSVPAEVKQNHADALKELTRTAKDIANMLPAQRVRIERLFLADRSWSLADWQQRYLHHPLLANLSRRLIWEFTTGKKSTLAGWVNNALIDVEDRPVITDATTRLRFWHPLHSTPDVVLAWRQWLERHQITQPFKQAHREVYILTDAERTTDNYSNRFAAHILRQHQFAALAQARGWTYRLMGNFDSHSVPTLRLPQHNLRVEYWLETGEQGELSATSIFLHVASDQVRFYELNAPDPMPLQQVPPILFSEIMRDVDLFVGVASIGNDPGWQDGGEQRHYGYWQNYSFGDLSASAKTRRAVLENLLPKLKIVPRCELLEKFLKVRGDLRTYKIHLGSGNILMEPNDQYLCIVASRSPGAKQDLFLPFEGDTTLSIILSKAFLLAADKKITDPTIIRQINPSSA